jgi:hypothetical protein
MSDQDRIDRARTYLRQLIALLQNPDGVQYVKDCEHIASLLFSLIREMHGEAEARRIHLRLGWPPFASAAAANRIFQWLNELSASKRQYLDDSELLFDLEMSRQSTRQFAGDIAAREGIEFETVHSRIKRAKARHRREGGFTSKK